MQTSRKKTSILAQSFPVIERLARHRWAALGVGGISLFGMVAAFGIATPRHDDPDLQRQTVIESLTLPSKDLIDTGPLAYLREERIQRGDTVASLLSRLGIEEQEALNFIRQSPSTQLIYRQLAPGKLVTAKTGESGQLLALYYPVNGKDASLVISRQGGQFTASEQVLTFESHTEVKSGEIRSSLFGATDAAGIPDAIATQLADIFGGDIDFHRDLRKGDRFTLVYEMLYHDGQGARSGHILAAEFVNDGHSYQAIYFPTPQAKDGKGGYYTPDGKNLRKALLRSPLEFSRVTSGFTSARFHPILQQWRAHKGVDYGAPTGTRVRATADGTVDFAGRQGGYGNLIVLHHQGRYSTAYGHLSSFAPGLHQGSRIAQGDVIGFVGATGWATGPHLHYEFRVSGEPVNPLVVALPTALPLVSTDLARFNSYAEPLSAQLAQLKQTQVAANFE